MRDMPAKLKTHVPAHRRGSHATAHRKVYFTKGWASLRQAALLRDEWTCQACGKPLYGDDATCDHIQEMQHGGAALPGLAGVQSLCRSCNSRKARASQVGYSFHASSSVGKPV